MVDSILDQDLYKLTMQQAVLKLYPRARAKYRFVNRNPNQKFTSGMRNKIKERIQEITNRSMTADESSFLRAKCRFLYPWYIDWLTNFRPNPCQIDFDLKGTEGCEDGQLVMTIEGPWCETIYWEVPLLAAITEVIMYEQMRITDTAEIRENTKRKAVALREGGCRFADFGTRRRFSFLVHEVVLNQLIAHGKSYFLGTSNVRLARQHGVRPIGTMAHEWIQAISGLVGLRHANRFALEAWNKVYEGRLGIALTDTFGSAGFWRDFDGVHSRLFDGVRQDSGDPINFAMRAVEHYKSLGIDPISKTVVFSDSLNVEKACHIQRVCGTHIKCAFGIGTNLTNDVPGTTPANIVIKLVEIDGIPVVKLSDDPGKAIGDPTAIDVAKWTFSEG